MLRLRPHSAVLAFVFCTAMSQAALAVVTVNNQGGGDALTIQAGIDLAIATSDPVVEIVGGLEYSGTGNRAITLRGNGLTVRSAVPGPQAVVDAVASLAELGGDNTSGAGPDRAVAEIGGPDPGTVYAPHSSPRCVCQSLEVSVVSA